MAVTLAAGVLERYPRFSLYNSPYPAHDDGRAVDLYPHTEGDAAGSDRPIAGGAAPSPVAGEVLDTRTVEAPPEPYAAEHDHLILIDTGDRVARVLHVDPGVAPGDLVAVGDSLGTLVRSGFFAPWVDNHLHLGFRGADADPYRASGSLRLELDPELDLRPLAWDGAGTVVEAGDTYAVLDSPVHPDPGACFVGVDGGGCVLDGGLPHYDGGGLLGDAPPQEARIAGQYVGTADGRTVTWDDPTVRVRVGDGVGLTEDGTSPPREPSGDPITGISLFCARDAGFGAKLICPDRPLEVGQSVTVTVA